ncbi:hypothetical protein PO124_16380 [Bacillus licheniformis]|nr:hypothetical protein [Bacillus licheniformis]
MFVASSISILSTPTPALATISAKSSFKQLFGYLRGAPHQERVKRMKLVFRFRNILSTISINLLPLMV